MESDLRSSRDTSIIVSCLNSIGYVYYTQPHQNPTACSEVRLAIAVATGNAGNAYPGCSSISTPPVPTTSSHPRHNSGKTSGFAGIDRCIRAAMCGRAPKVGPGRRVPLGRLVLGGWGPRCRQDWEVINQ